MGALPLMARPAIPISPPPHAIITRKAKSYDLAVFQSLGPAIGRPSIRGAAGLYFSGRGMHTAHHVTPIHKVT